METRPPTSDHSPVDGLAEEFLERHRRGEHPAIAEYVERYPEWADEIREVFPALVMMEQFKPAPEELTGSHPAGPAGRGRPPDRLGEYRILREIGRGGMGVVYEAVQEPLGRHVALKVLPWQGRIDAVQLGRFRLEASSAARLHHTNIVPVFGVGEHDGVHYYSMQFIHGTGLDVVLRDLRRLRDDGSAIARGPDGGEALTVSVAVAHGLLSGAAVGTPTAFGEATTEPNLASDSGVAVATVAPSPAPSDRSGLTDPSQAHYYRSVARIGVQVADALAYAHAHGVLHRDIKPSNLLLDAEGQAWVADFGLAKLEGSEGPTRTGDVVGTLRYMAPERFAGRSDPRSDVYGLGATLYELLVLRPAFDEADRPELVDRVLRESPAPPRRLDPRVPRDLETIVLKAMAKDPQDRFRAAAELRDELERVVQNRPTRTRPLSPPERLWRWCKRNPLVAGLNMLAATLTIVIAVVSTAAAYRNSRLAGQLKGQRDQANELATTLERQLTINRVNLAQREWLNNNVGLAEQLLDRCPEPLRGWEWAYCKRLCHLDLLTHRNPGRRVCGLAVSPDGRRIASADNEGSLTLWEAATGKDLYAIRHDIAGQHLGTVLAFHPRGTRLALACRGAIKLLDAANGRVVQSLAGTGDTITGLAFSSNGRLLAASSYDGQGTIQVWEVGEEAKPLYHIRATPWTHTIAFSPDGRRLASAESAITLWDMATGRKAGEVRGHPWQVYAVAFSPDGRHLATGGWDRTVRLWDVKSGAPLATLRGHAGYVRSVAFSPDGRRLATAAEDNAVKVWDAVEHRELFTLRGHSSFVRHLAFSPDGTRLVSGADDGTVKIWDGEDDPLPTLSGHIGWVRSVAFSPDGRWIAAGIGWWTPCVRLWHAASGAMAREFPGQGEYVKAVAFGDGGRLIASGGADGTIILRNAATGEVEHTLRGHAGFVTAVAFRPGDRLVASAGEDGTVRFWDATTEREIARIPAHSGIAYSLAFNPVGDRLASAGDEGVVKLWEVDSRRCVLTLPRTFSPQGNGTSSITLAFSPDGRHLAAAGGEHDERAGEVAIWDLESGREVLKLQGHTLFVNCVAYSPDGRRIATASNDGTVKLWDARTGEDVFTLRGHASGVLSVAFSPDGTKIASGGIDFTIRIWDSTGFDPREARLRRVPAMVRSLSETLLLKEDVIERLRQDPALDEPARELALAIAASSVDDPGRLNNASWAIVRDPNRPGEDYLRALRYAEAATLLRPEDGTIFNTLGVARYRAGRHRETLEALEQSVRRNSPLFKGPHPADLAFIAMAHHRLRQPVEAREAFGRLREAMKAPRWAADPESQQFSREAEALLELPHGPYEAK